MQETDKSSARATEKPHILETAQENILMPRQKIELCSGANLAKLITKRRIFRRFNKIN